ncbi:MAG: histidine kinase [Flavobacteriales bacterium]|nr:histidine kinase [Flavobacteriales bacterium]
MPRSNLLKEPWPRIIGIPLVALALSVLFNDRPWSVRDYLITVFITGIIWQGCFTIISFFRKRFPGFERTPRRIALTIAVMSAFILAIDYLSCTVLDMAGIQENAYANGQWKTNLIKCFGTTALIGTMYEAGYFFAMWKRQAIEAEALKSRQLRAELDILRNQVSPHFLFNSLNTLVALIPEDPQLAMRFTKDLSAVYRYILQHKDKELVDLGTELDFTAAYINLMKVRFEDALNITIRVEDGHRQLLVAPLTLQLLLENALKHNVASIAHPLQVDIHVENNRTLVVRNNLLRRQGTVEGTGTGLSNVKQRYAILSDRPVDVIGTREHFLVALPLLQLGEHEPIDR